MTPEEVEREVRARIRSEWTSPSRRRMLQRALIISKGRKRWRQERVRRMSIEELLNNWAAAPADPADQLVDLGHLPDWQLAAAAFGYDIGHGDDATVLADSAIQELAKRANAARLTVADYVRRRVGPLADEG